MRKFIVIVMLFSLIGCGSQVRQSVMEITDQHVADVENLKISAEKIALISMFEVGLIRGALGYQINELSAEALKVLERIEELTEHPEGLNDADKGYLLGLWVRFYSSAVLEVLRIYAPDILKSLRLVL